MKLILREAILGRDNFTCQTCGVELGELEVHHVIPRKLGGMDIPENLITVCRPCHELIEPFNCIIREPKNFVEGRKAIWIPEDLHKKIKDKAASEHKIFRFVVADLLEKGLK